MLTVVDSSVAQPALHIQTKIWTQQRCTACYFYLLTRLLSYLVQCLQVMHGDLVSVTKEKKESCVHCMCGASTSQFTAKVTKLKLLS